MTGPVLYSTNPWYAAEVARKYRQDRHFVWCSEFYNPSAASAASAASAIAPSSSPKGIYDALHMDVEKEERHSALIGRYKRTFRRLAKIWLADGSLTKAQHDEITAVVGTQSWKIWAPVLYVIPREPIVATNRLSAVPHGTRAGYGPEFQIVDLLSHEFDMIVR